MKWKRAGNIPHGDLPKSIISTNEDQVIKNSEIWDSRLTLREILEKVEKKALECAFKKYKTQAKTAKALGINQSTIARKFKKYKVK